MNQKQKLQNYRYLYIVIYKIFLIYEKIYY